MTFKNTTTLQYISSNSLSNVYSILDLLDYKKRLQTFNSWHVLIKIQISPQMNLIAIYLKFQRVTVSPPPSPPPTFSPTVVIFGKNLINWPIKFPYSK